LLKNGFKLPRRNYLTLNGNGSKADFPEWAAPEGTNTEENEILWGERVVSLSYTLRSAQSATTFSTS
jgi:hypothetical protein